MNKCTEKNLWRFGLILVHFDDFYFVPIYHVIDELILCNSFETSIFILKRMNLHDVEILMSSLYWN